MANLKITPNMTNAHSGRIADFIETSHKEMAHWSGTGPDDTECHQCEHFHYVEFRTEKLIRAAVYKRGDKEGQLKDEGRPCMKFRRMMSVDKSRRIPPRTPSCMFFEAIKS